MRFIFLFLIFYLCVLQNQVNGSKILVIASMPAHSHYTLAYRIAKELADRNHEVTFITPFLQKNPIKNLKEIFIEGVTEFVDEYRKSLFKAKNLGIIADKVSESDLGFGLVDHLYNSQGVKKLLSSDSVFDVVILEHFFNDAAMGIAHRFKAPLILISPLASGNRANHLFANPAPSSYVPDVMGSYTKNMNFWERLHNFVSNNFQDLLREIIYLPKQRMLFKRFIKTDLELDDLMYNVSLMLTNSHISTNDPIPHVPSIVEIGGYHVSPPKKLPADLQEYLDSSSDGVVVFSMGSNLKSKDLNPEIRRSLLKSFAKVKQNILWKFETDLAEASKNVKIMKWLPQQDVLAHPNVRAFITHGGLLSTIEAVYHGIPIIGIPVFGDQSSNIASAVSYGYGISVPLAELTEEKFSWALNQILENPKYSENVKKRSRLMHDQPLKPTDLAIFWIEHVIRHRGAPHLRSAGLDLKWYQREMIDIFLFITLSIFVVTLTIYMLIRRLCNRKQSVSSIKKNK